ncbi:MAG: hypothetical protein U1C72_00615 [Candidatus Pacearchaeota archaeon]|nr:hypothetical protein [Candidatus Pacearchaeota archaeon]
MIVFFLESFRPPRECLVKLCEQAKDKGLLDEVPKSRGTSPFMDALRRIGREHHPLLVIDDLSTITSLGVHELRKLKDSFTIVANLDRRSRHRAAEIFFGASDTLELQPLTKAEARQLAKDASQDLDLPERSTFVADVANQADGNPQVVLDLVDRARRTQDHRVERQGAGQCLPATPFLSLFLLWCFVGRYTASSMGEPDFKILLALAIAALSITVVLDKVLVMGSKL